MATRMGGMPVREREKSTPVVGPTPPPGTAQPTRAHHSDEDIDDDDDNDDDDNSRNGGTPFTGLKDETIARILIDTVKADDRDTVYYIRLVQRVSGRLL
ncbi:hypothetical protein C8A01DRAFT_45092 [Parachaetomium inaequale]|uniref:Uncharacterized protein n=1 Tax=Parachaetomium inaequale TaxID=2588326 RepID=A0AAN6PNS6_9PEZI|nr:hypothetical protein C8A01DRAFT_45092 [Parachaetomium inaequale]